MTPEKIRAIKRYLSTNGVKYYDVQAELIDHFATAVEKAEKENPNIPFKHALIQAHRSFGGREVLENTSTLQKRMYEKRQTVLSSIYCYSSYNGHFTTHCPCHSFLAFLSQ